MIVALTGTPGCGKTTAAGILASRNFQVTTVEELARKHGAIEGDEADNNLSSGEIVVDVEKLAGSVKYDSPDLIIEGHLAHFLPCDVVVVLRCNPDVVSRRLLDRGYSPEKARENAEAEAVDLILVEALDINEKVYEIDTTNMSPDEVAEAVSDAISGKGGNFGPGKIDWSRVVLDWY